MNKAHLVAEVSNKTGLSKKDAENAVNAVTSSITEELAKGGKVQLIGFGTFSVQDRAARKCKNPKTGEEMDIPACKAPKFKAGQSLKDKIN